MSSMDFPDVVPWLDAPADDYDELPAADHDLPYDE